MAEDANLSTRDAHELAQLAQAHRVLAVLLVIVAAVCVIDVVLFSMRPDPTPQDQAGSASEWIEGVIHVVSRLFLAVLAAGASRLITYAGRCIRERRDWHTCRAIGLLQLLIVPLGTLLGLATFSVLSRPDVRTAFDAK